MESHIRAKDAEPAATGAWLHQAVTGFDMLQGTFICVNLTALSITAFKLESHQILLDHPVHLAPVHLLIALALLGTVVVVLSPGKDAGGAEYGLAPAALQRILYHVRADRANEEIRSVPLLLVRLL